jgi:hypothetical protein
MTEEINVEQAPVEDIPEFLRQVDENGKPIPVAVQTPEDTGEHDKVVN